MTAENFDEMLKTLFSEEPFQAFTVELHGGRRFEVDHQRMTAFRNGVAVYLAPGGRPIIFDHDSVKQIITSQANTDVG